ncbi:RNA polymerase sigma factor ShbA [Lentzea sp. NPDC006480]|uniref:RNA polymerase sigma factor ShbA n=1 Tax=Lentzea sp. NPDC006480 TaxID=3157176 RepID=UPI0033BEA883
MITVLRQESASSSSTVERQIEAEARAASAGDAGATTRLLALLQPLVIRYCRARINRINGALVLPEDVAQEIYLGILRALPTLCERRMPFLPFVYGIASHKVCDAVRAGARNRADPVADTPDVSISDQEPEQLALNAELSTRLGKLLDELPARQKEVLVLRIVVGLSAAETARAVGSTSGGVRVTQHRALTKLRSMVRADQGLLAEGFAW